MEMDIGKIRSKLNFDPRLIVGANKYMTRERFTKRIMEYKVWAMGNSSILRMVYRENALDGDGRDGTLQYFWHAAPVGRRMLHTGIPGLICTRKADILFGSGLSLDATVYSSSPDAGTLTENKTASEQVKDLADNLFHLINMQQHLQSAAVIESWSGHCFFKLSHDVSLSDYPIIETTDLTTTEVIKVRGVTKAIVFRSWYRYRDNDYRLDEIYGTNAEGDATITYKLFRFDGDREVEIPLLSVPQMAERFMVGSEGNPDGIHLDENATFTYTGLKGMLAFEKPNKTPSTEFPDSPYGASDFERSIDSFDCLDEIYSANAREIRTNATRFYFPDELIPKVQTAVKDREGRTHYEMVAGKINEFEDNIQIVRGSQEQDAQNKIQYDQVPDKTQSYLDKWRVALTTICNNAKISPFSLGTTWLEAVNPSAESQKERNKVTLDMRKASLRLWQPFLEEILLRILQLNSWMRQNTNVEQPFTDFPVTWDNTTIHVKFGEYIEDSVPDLLTTWGGAKSARVASTETCVREIHPSWTEKQVQEEVNRIRYEDGMAPDDPTALPDLTGTV